MRHTELTLDQMLADPIVHLVTGRDGVTEAQVRRLMGRLRRTRMSTSPGPVAATAEVCRAA